MTRQSEFRNGLSLETESPNRVEKASPVSSSMADRRGRRPRNASRPGDRDAAIGKQRRSGGEARGIRSQEERRAGDLFGLCHTLQGMQVFDEGPGFRGLERR